MAWKATAELSNMIKHYANFPATGVSLRQMYALSGQRNATAGADAGLRMFLVLTATITGCNSAAIPQQVSQRSSGIEHGSVWLTGSAVGTLFRASQFLSEELPIRLAHRVEELADLPDGLNEMPSIKRVQEWYAQSFEVRRSE